MRWAIWDLFVCFLIEGWKGEYLLDSNLFWGRINIWLFMILIKSYDMIWGSLYVFQRCSKTRSNNDWKQKHIEYTISTCILLLNFTPEPLFDWSFVLLCLWDVFTPTVPHNKPGLSLCAHYHTRMMIEGSKTSVLQV
jgi:hypothetical protein